MGRVRGGIAVAAFEIRSDGGHEVAGLGARQRAMAALAGDLDGIVYSHRALQRIFAVAGDALETDIDGRHRRLRRPDQIYIAHGKRAGKLS